MVKLYFYDLPVYRVSYEEYSRKMEKRLTVLVANAGQGSGITVPKSTIDALEQRQYEKLGPWQFNEIIGYVRLHFFGSQIRGEYFSAEKIRNPIGRTRVFLWHGSKLAPEIDLAPQFPATNSQVWDVSQHYIGKCRKELRKGRVIDDTCLLAIGPHVDWLSVLGWA